MAIYGNYLFNHKSCLYTGFMIKLPTRVDMHLKPN